MLADNLEETEAHNLTIHKITEASYFIFEPLLPLSRVIFEGLTLTGTSQLLEIKLDDQYAPCYRQQCQSHTINNEGIPTLLTSKN